MQEDDPKQITSGVDFMDPEPPAPTPPRTWYHRYWIACRKHAGFIGPGIIASVAYFDPGNWATDLAAGSQYGYSLLFVVLCAGLGAILYQVLSCRLGIVTGKDLAQHLRLRFHSRPKHTLLWRWGVLYPLYALSEVAIIATDMAEALGSAIALNLLFPKLPLYAGVIVTAADVLVVLMAYRPDGGARQMRLFEIGIACLVLGVFVSYVVLLFRISPEWGDVFKGYLPSKDLVKPGALYTSVGIIGATVMPHALFLGSKLSTVDRLTLTPSPSALSSTTAFSPTPSIALEPMSSLEKTRAKLVHLFTAAEDEERETCRVSGIRTHLTHATIDIVLSLFCFAVTINSAILIVAAASFYYSSRGGSTTGDLFGAYELIKDYIGKGSAFLFAFALLCAGQSASITATLAGQVVSEGFLKWKLSPFVRRLVTRTISIIPAVIIAVASGRKGLDTLLVASQVILSLILPFVVFPLVYLTSSRSGVMQQHVPPQHPNSTETSEGRIEDFSVAWYVTAMGYLLFVVMLAANVYALVQLGSGSS